MSDHILTKEHLAELIPHIESALEDGYPLQLKGDDLRFLLEAIKARLAAEPSAVTCMYGYGINEQGCTSEDCLTHRPAAKSGEQA